VRRIALTLAALVLVAFPATAAGARAPVEFLFTVSSGNIDELVRFQGDPASCAAHGVCGYVGTLHYGFKAKSGYAVAIFPGRGEPLSAAFSFLDGHGTTTADVALDGGSGIVPHCTDAVSNEADGFGASLRGRRTTVFLHPALDSILSSGTSPPGSGMSGFDDTLRTHCAGPSDADLAASHASPSRRYSVSRFRRRRFDLVLSGTRPFRAAGFYGTARFRVRFRLAREGTSGVSPADNTISIIQLSPKANQIG
jgi:hypothetical protein